MYLIGIAGGTGSGKTTFVNRLKKVFQDKVLFISYDSYYKSQENLPREERSSVNYDCPDVLDTELLISHLKDLLRGKSIKIPIYDFKEHIRLPQIISVEPKPVVIVDGILTFQNDELRSLFNLKIFVDVNADERILRRIKRDVEERGRTIDSVINQYLSTVQPMHDIYVEPTKKYADIIINGGMNDAAYDLIKNKINFVEKL